MTRRSDKALKRSGLLWLLHPMGSPVGRSETVWPNLARMPWKKKVNPVLKFLGYFWGPIPWMIEASAILSGIVRHWDDLIIISILLVFNALVGFWQEYKAANALEALKKRPSKRQVAGNCCPQLVPGDVIRLPCRISFPLTSSFLMETSLVLTSLL